MNRRHFLGFIFAAPIALAAAPVRATSEHDYSSGEYAIIRDGLSPDRLMSLAAHGDGEGGHGNFHVWLMAEPAHRKIMMLDDIATRIARMRPEDRDQPREDRADQRQKNDCLDHLTR